MAKNYIQPGETLTMVAPSGGVESGAALVIENLFMVALTAAAEGDEFEARTTGVFMLPKAAAASAKDFDAGEPVFWNGTAGEIDKTATGRFKVGVAAMAAASTDEHVAVRLDGIAVTAV
jgi:predicted RecA/RadA family phage recombinase